MSPQRIIQRDRWTLEFSDTDQRASLPSNMCGDRDEAHNPITWTLDPERLLSDRQRRNENSEGERNTSDKHLFEKYRSLTD